VGRAGWTDCAVRFITIVKKVVSCIATFLFSATLSGAALLLNDTFGYPDSSLVTAAGSPWTTYSGTITGQVKVVAGRIFLSKANSEDVHAALAGQPYASTSGAILYVSFKINYTNLPSSAGSYFAEFKNGSTDFRARIFAQTAGAASGTFRVGIANAGSSPSAVFNADLQTNTDYTIVARLAVSNVVSTLWLNPTAETNAGVTATDAASALTITSYGFREDSAIGNLFVDDLRVGTTFPDVVTNAPPLERPTIVSQPQNLTVTNGANVTFSVNATGTPPLAYQWQLNNTNLPGATSSNLTLTAVTFAQAGFYTVVITNVLGSAGSEPFALSVWCASTPAFSYLTYNVNGNLRTDWSTTNWYVRGIGRQVQYLNPDIITFQEIPVTNNCTAQMADFVAAYRPGYYLVTNSADDGYIRSAILSRFPIVASRSWLHGVYLGPYGYTNASPSPYFARDLFEAQIAVPGFPQPLHVFTVHLKSGQAGPESSKRAAEASAVSNFFATIYLPTNGLQPYVLSGDLNEDILRPPDSNPQSIQRLVNASTGLQLATPVNLFTDSELTISIRDGLTKRYDYILPCAMLFSNIVRSQVFRTDLLNPLPPNLYSDDENASDHLPVIMFFGNPFNTPFRLLSIGATNQIVSLKWESSSNRQYHVEVSSNLTAWTPLVTNLTATGADFTFSTNVPGDVKFFRIRRAP
jgi:endonuclease/exonuclease/phosphatase family metal-dependent hydrolase